MGSSPKGSGELHAGCRTLQRIRRLIVLGAETAFLIRFSHSHLHRLGAGGAVAKAPCERRTRIRKDRLMAAQWTLSLATGRGLGITKSQREDRAVEMPLRWDYICR